MVGGQLMFLRRSVHDFMNGIHGRLMVKCCGLRGRGACLETGGKKMRGCAMNGTLRCRRRLELGYIDWCMIWSVESGWWRGAMTSIQHSALSIQSRSAVQMHFQGRILSAEC